MFTLCSINYRIFYVNTDQNGAFTAFSSIQSLNGLTLLNTMKHNGRAWSEGCESTIFEMFTLCRINYRFFYVNIDQNGAFSIRFRA